MEMIPASKILSFIIILLVSSSCATGSYFLAPPAPYITDLKGDPCKDNQTCLSRDPHAYCKLSTEPDNAICHCEKGFVSSSDRTHCLESDIRLGGPCEENQQCIFWETSTAVCLSGSGICDCIPGYIPSNDLTHCLPIIDVLGTQSCLEDAQCQLGKPGTFSKCTERNRSSSSDFRVCKCQDGAVNTAKDNKCYPVAQYPGDQCDIQPQCTVGLKHSRCMNKVCRCNQGYKLRERNGKRLCSIN